MLADRNIPPEGIGPEERPRKGIQSLVTGFRVIDYLVRVGKPAPLGEIAKGTGLSPSKLQFYLISLIEVRVVQQDKQTGHYGLGPYTLHLGIAGLQQFDIIKSAQPRMETFVARHGHTVFLGVWGNHGPTIVYRAGGVNSRSLLELRLGTVLPVLGSAVGRVFAAYLPDAITEPRISAEMATMDQPGPLPDPDMPGTLTALPPWKETIRQRRLARCRGGLLPDHTALSAPIFDYRDKIIASLMIMAPVTRMDDAFDSPVATDLRDVADAISQDAGQTTAHYLDF